MKYWTDGFYYSVEMYYLWMLKHKNRRKARYIRKLARINNRVLKTLEHK